jgi:hypothetical protein
MYCAKMSDALHQNDAAPYDSSCNSGSAWLLLTSQQGPQALLAATAKARGIRKQIGQKKRNNKKK